MFSVAQNLLNVTKKWIFLNINSKLEIIHYFVLMKINTLKLFYIFNKIYLIY